MELGGLSVHASGEGANVLVLLHGFGAPGGDLAGLAPILGGSGATARRLLFPAAPIDLGRAYAGGRAWWRIDLETRIALQAAGKGDDLRKEKPAGIDEALAALEAMLDAIAPVPAKLVLGGFSQGAMLATHLAMTTTRPLAGLVLLSGTVIAEPLWKKVGDARRGLPVFQSHGTGDPILEYRGAEALRDLLAAAGTANEFHSFRGGHEIPPPVLRALVAFLNKTL